MNHHSGDRRSRTFGRVARLLGLTVTRIGSGTALVCRSARGAPRLLRLRPGVTVVVDGKDSTAIGRVKLGNGTWIVGAVRGAGKRLDVARAGSRGWVVSRRDTSPQAEPLLEKQVMQLLGARHIAWLLDHYRVDCVLDVGANTGQYGQSLRRNGYQGHIVSFEPVPQFVEAVAKASADDDKWAVQPVGLGTVEGSMPIRVQRSFSSVLSSSEYGKRRFDTLREFADSEQIDIPVRRLDNILDEVLAPIVASGVTQPRVYLKMDTQGFDLEVFRGLGDRVSEVVAMQSEVALLLIYDDMPRMPEALATYEAAGFEVSGLYPVSVEPDGRVIEYDCVMVRADSIAESIDDSN